MTSLNRRQFIKKSSLVVGLGAILPAVSYSRAQGANDRVRIAIAGAGGRGGEQLGFYKKIPNIEIVEVVDPDSNRAAAMAKQIETMFGNKPRFGGDYRKMLENKDIDAVSVASCNHWHSLMGIWACQAGKDALVEKPCSYNIFEGRKLLEAAQKYNRIVQHGTQRRSQAADRKLVSAVHSEKYGKLIGCRVYVRRPRKSLGFKPITDPPANLDWDQWVGPAEMTPFHGNLVPYNWHWFWNTGNGEIGNNGVHHFDVARWGMQVKHPTSVISFGTRFVEDPKNNNKDQAETPSIHFALYDYNGIPLIYEGCNIAGPKEKWPRYELTEFHTDRGFLRGTKFYENGKGNGVEIEAEYEEPKGWLYENFIDRVRDRDVSKLDAPISEGHYSTAICHWGNLSYRCGKSATLKECEAAVGDNPIMKDSIKTVYDNLNTVLTGLDVREIPLTLGASIQIDGEKERCKNNPEADKLLSRQNPRKPYVVPDEV